MCFRVSSATGAGSSSVSVELERNRRDRDAIIAEIRNYAADVKLPADVIDDPNVRVFDTSRKAIIDVAIYYDSTPLMDDAARTELQNITRSLENRLLALDCIAEVSRSNYYQDEIRVLLDAQRLEKSRLSVSSAVSALRKNHVRQPAGTLNMPGEPRVTLNAELDTEEKIRNVVLQGGFEGTGVRLSQVAEVTQGFDRKTEIFKINGHEGLFLNVVKSGDAGILDAVEEVRREVERFQKTTLAGSPVRVTLLDDESKDVRSRLNIIGFNGTIGFLLIMVTLLIFLDRHSALWVTAGIPFSFAATLGGIWWLGYTINNVTLAAVIIVMGMVVDDAIVVAENVSRLRSRGMSTKEAAVRGTHEMFQPVLAAVLTTCVAFLPLYFFQGHFSQMNRYIPPIIF